MSRFALVALCALALTAAACGADGGPPPAYPAPAPPPPEPVLVRRGPVYVYTVDGVPVDGFPGKDGIDRGVRLDHAVILVRTPPGWTPSYAGDAAWLQSDADTRARIVVYVSKDHEKEFEDVWLSRDRSDPAVRASAVETFASPRRPFLYTYARTDDGRSGIVYALLADPDRPDSGVIVHGVWPSEMDRALRPVAVAIANHVAVTRTK